MPGSTVDEASAGSASMKADSSLTASGTAIVILFWSEAAGKTEAGMSISFLALAHLARTFFPAVTTIFSSLREA